MGADANEVVRLASAADRLDELAETAELMGDEPTATRMRGQAARMRDAAMNLLPKRPGAE